MNKIVVQAVILSLLISGAWNEACSQPFASEINAFKKQDSASFPPKGAILFVGSSSFLMWTDLNHYFPGYSIINRGFGGSSFPDVIRYADDIIFPYQPKQIVIYCGDNDFSFSDTVSSQTVFNRFKQLFLLIRKNMPGENVVFVSIKPSPSRVGQMVREEETNAWIKQFLSEQKNTGFVDVYHAMLNPNGKPISEIFKADSLHMNEKGYAIWQRLIKPYLADPDTKVNRHILN
jgi:lysophospholipase L1-like esterase